MAEILPRARDWNDQVDIIRRCAEDMHARHHIGIEGCRVSAGLIRITRVRHLQSLAIDLARLDPDCHLVVLHSAMPRLQRENIERTLKAALTRKGTDPEAGLRRFIADRLPGALHRKGSDIRIIILSSPVIETGNDVDFDWLITDPNSTRSIIQASGRINRHRRLSIESPNIALLGDYLVVRESGALQYPGVETVLDRKCGVASVRINGPRDTLSLIGQAEAFPVDARFGLASACRLSSLEADLRQGFMQESSKDHRHPAFWWSLVASQKHRFRRQDKPHQDAIPLVDGDRLQWGYFPPVRGSTWCRIRMAINPTSLFGGKTLFHDTILDLAAQTDAGIPHGLLRSASLSFPWDGEETAITGMAIDPILGLLPDPDLRPSIDFQAQ